MTARLNGVVMSDNRYYVNSRKGLHGIGSPIPRRFPSLFFDSDGLRYAARTRGSYILYFPKSSSFSPSSHLRRSSLVTRSDMLAASLEVFSTPSSTKMGQSTRSAKASASDGRESMLITSPPRSSQITA